MTSFVALLTDFGLEDAYVAALKSIILQNCPATSFIDISHSIAPQNIEQAAVLLESAYPFLPINTITLVVVDPEVGTARRVLLVEKDHRKYIAPDNGILTPILLSDPKPTVHCIEIDSERLKNASNTFHGRDIFAPFVSELLQTNRLQNIQTMLASPKIIANYYAKPNRISIQGRIVYSDHFGNLITNIRMNPEVSDANFWLNGQSIPFHKTYADAADGEIFTLLNSMGRYEIAVKNNSASQRIAYQQDQQHVVEMRH